MSRADYVAAARARLDRDEQQAREIREQQARVDALYCQGGVRLDGEFVGGCPCVAATERTVEGVVFHLCAEHAAELDREVMTS